MTPAKLLGLEYVLLFGLPGNKLEMVEGRTRCSSPFLDRSAAEAHFQHWLETLCRWQGCHGVPAVRKSEKVWSAEVGQFQCELYPLPVNIHVPFDFGAFDQVTHTYWWRDLWDGQPAGLETGWGCFLDHQDVIHNLYWLFDRLAGRVGGASSSRCDIAVNQHSAVQPDAYLYLVPREECLIDGQYFQGAPHMIAEVLSPPSHMADRGPRRELYRRAGVPHYWIVDPELETMEVFHLSGEQYQTGPVYRPGDRFALPWCPDQTIDVAEIFVTQRKRNADDSRTVPASMRVGILKIGEVHELADTVPEWLYPADLRLGLEYLLVLGHPDRRWEIWNNRAPCVLAFGSAAEAKLRFTHFLEDICRWEGVPLPKNASAGNNDETVEVGRFGLTRQDHRVHLEVAVDARRYRAMLETWAKREAWDWGESDEESGSESTEG